MHIPAKGIGKASYLTRAQAGVAKPESDESAKKVRLDSRPAASYPGSCF
jgi:hypothetical protein